MRILLLFGKKHGKLCHKTFTFSEWHRKSEKDRKYEVF